MNNNSPAINETQKSNGNKIVTLLVTVAVIGLVGVTGFLVYKFFLNKNPALTTQNFPIPQTTVTSLSPTESTPTPYTALAPTEVPTGGPTSLPQNTPQPVISLTPTKIPTAFPTLQITNTPTPAIQNLPVAGNAYPTFLIVGIGLTLIILSLAATF